jgi:phage gp36-like protein
MYISIDDLRKGIRSEVLDALMRGDVNVATQAIVEAEAEVSAYLSARYAIADELQKNDQSVDRVSMVVKLVRDIAIYNIHSFSAPVNMPENKLRAYEDAVRLLRDCQAEKASIAGLRRLFPDGAGGVSSSYVLFGGNEKRNNQF